MPETIEDNDPIKEQLRLKKLRQLAKRRKRIRNKSTATSKYRRLLTIIDSNSVQVQDYAEEDTEKEAAEEEETRVEEPQTGSLFLCKFNLVCLTFFLTKRIGAQRSSLPSSISG